MDTLPRGCTHSALVLAALGGGCLRGTGAWEAEWDRDPADGDVSTETSPDGTSSEDDDGPIEAVIPATDGPALVAALSDDDPVVVEAAVWALGRVKAPEWVLPGWLSRGSAAAARRTGSGRMMSCYSWYE